MLPVRTSPEGATAGPTTRVILGLLLLFSALLASASSAYPLDDVLGWRNTRWGMTEADVKGSLDTLGLPLTPLPPPYGRALGADAPFKTTVEIAGSHYDAIFVFPDDTRRLGRVLIRTVTFSRHRALELHSTLARVLTEQLGPPGETESQGSIASLTRWMFKTTSVVLSMDTDTAVPGNHVTHLAVVYAPTTTMSDDTKDKLLGLGILRALGEVGRGTH
jgi:hypothetical protein